MGRYPRTIFHAYFKLMGETTLDGECWVKIRRPKGRPVVSVQGKRYLAARVVLFAHLGLDIEDQSSLACHRCDNPQCYSPYHLYIGNKSTNKMDYERTLYGVRQST